MRLIDADELKKPIEVAIKDSGFYRPIYQGFAKAIDVAPTVDAAPVVHGHWIEEDGYQICSNCGEEHAWAEYRANYCDVCGAKMDEVSE